MTSAGLRLSAAWRLAERTRPKTEVVACEADVFRRVPKQTFNVALAPQLDIVARRGTGRAARPPVLRVLTVVKLRALSLVKLAHPCRLEV